jgi:hypothetical protein
MVTRCTQPSHGSYKDYGAAGITVDSSWLDFNRFLEDMGDKPDPTYQLDRVDNTKGYSKGNCRWASPTHNTINSRPRNGRKYKGVYQQKGRTEYFVLITWKGKPLYGGSFKSEKEAALRYNELMIEHYGNVLGLNKIEGE